MKNILTNEEIKAYVDALIPVSEQAGKAILDIYNRDDRGIQNKSDASPLTMADLASNEIICNALGEIAPDIPIISEENEHLPYSDREQWPYCWVVDPLDGTKEFIKKNGEFTTNIGLVHKQRVIAGVIYLPVADEMYFAIRGMGAFQIRDGVTEKLTASSYHIDDEGLKVVCSRSHLNDETQAYFEKLNDPQKVARGSSLKFIAIAKGEAHLYPRMAPTMEWDTCAAQIILEEAGGQVVQALDEDKVVEYNKENLRNPYFIAKGNERN